MADLSFKLKNDLKSPTELVVYWTEYVLRHKGALHLRTKDADIPYYQFLLLDVFILIFSIVLISVYSLVLLTKFVRKIF